MESALEEGDAGIPGWLAGLGLPGIVDVHVHFMPERVQRRVWAHFDRLDPAWPILYRTGERQRLETLAAMGVTPHRCTMALQQPPPQARRPPWEPGQGSTPD